MTRKDEKNDKNGEPPQSTRDGIPVVGIGASAGGIGALEALLPLLKANGGVAYVVVQHLDPNHDSALTALLNRGTEMPVVEASDGGRVEPDHIYVIPRNSTLTLSDD